MLNKEEQKKLQEIVGKPYMQPVLKRIKQYEQQYGLQQVLDYLHDIILASKSLKTSLRERAGQTYRWKLLLEIATTENQIKDKYNIAYDSAAMPIVCFATVNFYNEINNPQHRGMLKFFDNAFIGKPVHSEFIARLSGHN